MTPHHSTAALKKWDHKFGDSPISILAKNIYPKISQDVIDYVNEYSFTLSIKKGKHLIRSGQKVEYVYFIVKGLMRAYIKEDERELTTWMNTENNIITSANGFILQQPSAENIQALENCELIALSFTQLQFLYDNYLDANYVGRKLVEHLYLGAEERANICRLKNAMLKYTSFVEKYGKLVNRAPLKYVASYLGMTLETLSRIRNKYGE